MKTTPLLQRLVQVWKTFLQKFSGNATSSDTAENGNSHEILEPRILYTAAPVEPAPAAEPTPTEDAATITTEAPAPEVAPAAQEPAADEAPAADGETEVSADQNVELVEVDTSDTALNEEALLAIAEAAAQRWADSGLSAEQSAALAGASYQVADLGNVGANIIGSAEGYVITLDDDAAGRGWFIDSTPDEDSEFASAANPVGIDLLSVVLHEQGHVLGLDDSGATDGGVMFSVFSGGERRLPENGQADNAVAGSLDGAHYATTTWDGSTDTDWSVDPDSTSWGGGADTIYNDGDDALFDGSGAGTVNITGNVNPASVSVTGGNYTFADGGGSIGGSGSLNKSGGGDLTIQTANTFTGGVDLSGGRILIRDGANEQSYLGDSNNTLTFSGNATLHNIANTITLPQNIAVNGGVTGTFTGAFAENIDVNGVLSGSGDLIFQGFSAGPTWDFLNTGNTFTGSIVRIDGSAGHAVVGFSRPGGQPGPTTIGLASDGSNGGQFVYKGAINPLVLNNRQFELVNNGNSGTN